MHVFQRFQYWNHQIKTRMVLLLEGIINREVVLQFKMILLSISVVSSYPMQNWFIYSIESSLSCGIFKAQGLGTNFLPMAFEWNLHMGVGEGVIFLLHLRSLDYMYFFSYPLTILCIKYWSVQCMVDTRW